MGNLKVISDRDVNEWIIGCPIRITNVKLTKDEDDASPRLTVSSEACGDFGRLTYTARVEYKNPHREIIGGAAELTLACGASEAVDTNEPSATYASVTVQSVSEAGKVMWTNDGKFYVTLPEQEILWQTDPHYDVIRRECSGVTDAKYIPDTIDGAWRCTCGGVNLDSSEKCGRCGVGRDWLSSHFDREYLEARKAELAGDKKVEKKKKKHVEHTIPAWVKAAGVLLVLAVIITLGVFTFTRFIPQAKYDKAVALAENGEYDAAIEIFRELGDYADSAKRVENTVYKKAQSMTGIDDVYVSDSARLPWFSITEDGVLSFDEDEFAERSDSIIIPDVLDGVIVRELSHNCFINCDRLVYVALSDCTEVIGEQAFYNCISLEVIELGEGLKTIMPRAFINCTSLEEIVIPDSVQSIGVRAFNNCTALKKAVLGEGIRELPAYLFSNCTSLKRITLVSPVSSVGENAFSDCESFEKIFCRFPESEFSPEIADGNDVFAEAVKYFDQ